MRKISYILIFMVITGAMSSCTKGFEDLNQDPNTSSIGTPDELFSYGVLRYHTDYTYGVQTEIWALSSWMQVQSSISGITSADQAYFINGEEGINSAWSLMYADVLGNISEAIRLTDGKADDANRNAMYRMYRAYLFQRITDLWGHVPFSEAHSLINEQNVPEYTPEYDNQSQIYSALISDIKDAVAQLDPALETPAGQDWLYGGDVGAWRRFGNSLLLRMAIRVSDVSPGLTADALQGIDAEADFMTSNTQSAAFPHNSAARSAFYELHNTGQGMYNPSKFLLDKFVQDADPRIARFAEYSPESVVFGTNQYVGVPSFVPTSQVDPNTQNDFTMSYIGDYFLDVNRPSYLISHSEVQFLLAEAVLQGHIASDAQYHYENGVRAHMHQLEIEQDDIETYMSANGAFNGTLEQIITEKWKTFVYTDPIELYSEWRRTGFPKLLDNDGQVVNTNSIPVRLAYPNSELSQNSENVYSVGHGINDFFTPHWWDQ